VQPIPIPSRCFTHIHVNLVGPLPLSSRGFNYIFTMIDRSTKWLEAVPFKDVSATSCADTFKATWVSRFGVLDCIASERGPQFTSAVWSILCARLGISYSLKTAFHPQSNGMVERGHRQLKDALRVHAAGHDWPSHLPRVLLGLQAALKEDTITYHLLSGALLQPSLFLGSSSPSQNRRHRSLWTACPPANLLQAKFVYIYRGCTVPSLQPLYAGP
jgi:hypothetical protein